MRKKLSLLLALTLFVSVFNSCSSDDDSSENNANSQITGTWGTEWNSGNGVTVNPKFTFVSNGNVKYYTYPNGSQPVLEEIGTWNLNGDILIMEFPEDVLIRFKNKVTFLSETEMDFEEINEDGFDSWSTQTYIKTDDPNLN